MIVEVESCENQYVFNNLFFTFYPCVLLVLHVVKPKNLLKTQKQTKTKNQKNLLYLLQLLFVVMPCSFSPRVPSANSPTDC